MCLKINGYRACNYVKKKLIFQLKLLYFCEKVNLLINIKYIETCIGHLN
jgi:hypothetical protein